MALFTSSGWLDTGSLRARVLPFTFIWGGRGIGKTYGWLKSVRYDQPAVFILLRRSQAMVDIMANPDFSPFRAIDRDTGRHTAVCRLNKYIVAFYDGVEEEDGIVHPQGPPVGYAMALSTIHNVRGFSAEDVEYIIYDEFIPEAHERGIKNEYEALLNAYETINRNRELLGREPVRLVGLTNANNLGNPYFLGLGLIRRVERMIQTGTAIWEDQERGIMLVNITRSPISEAKRDTALYRLSGDGGYAAMSLDNEFSGEARSQTGSVPLVECVPVVHVGEICIYRHKSRDIWYVSDKVAGSPETYTADNTSLSRCYRKHYYLINAYLANKLVFADYLCEILFRQYWGLT